MSEIWIILVGCLVAIPCAILGSFLVLRNMVMVADAISHAVLPGIVFAFMFTGKIDSPFLVFFASLFGVITTYLIEFFHKKARLQADASIGVVFTWMFAIGIIMISIFAKSADLDQDCVLYGEIINVPFNIWITDAGTNMGPVSVWILGIVTFLVILIVSLSYKELKITTFDPGFAQIVGISVSLWHYVLMTMVSVVTVSAFESVGAILVVAFIVIPAATAFLLTKRLSIMLFVSVLVGVMSVVFGYQFAKIWNANTSAMMAVCAGFFFICALIWNLFAKKLVNLSVNEQNLSA